MVPGKLLVQIVKQVIMRFQGHQYIQIINTVTVPALEEQKVGHSPKSLNSSCLVATW